MALTKRQQIRKKYGVCIYCGEELHTSIYCVRCARKSQRNSEKVHLSNMKKGLCRLCRQPRGDDGTGQYCRKCADRRAEYVRRRRKNRIENSLCPDHGTPTRRFKYCLKCRGRKQQI